MHSGIALALVALLLGCATARADWNGDAHADVLAIDAAERLLLYRGNGAGGWVTGGADPIGTAWGDYTALLSPGDFNGDAAPDLIARRPDGALLLFRGNGAGGFLTGMGEPIGTGWQSFTALLAPGDFSGDGKPDVIARHPDGRLLLYRGNGAGRFLGGALEIGVNWAQFDAVLAPGDFSGDGKPDVIARHPDGRLLLYRGNGTGGWVTGRGEQIGTGWQSFAALAAGDFSGDGKPDVLGKLGEALLLYRGNGTGGWASMREKIGTGWGPLRAITVTGPFTPPPPPPPPPAPPSAPLPDGRVQLDTGIRCTPPGGRLRVSLRVRRRPGRAAPRVLRVVFFVRGGPRRVDRRRPYVVRLPLNRPAGDRGRVYARVAYRREGKRVRHKTVSRRFVMCR
jgi:hypothetical protein